MVDIFQKLLHIPTTQPVLLLAPMEGITNHIFRSTLLENVGGPDIVATEFIKINSEKQKVRPFKRHAVPLQIQIMGCSPEIIAGNLQYLKAQQVLTDSDWLDLNVGCPSKKVTAKGSGSALLKTPAVLISIIENLRAQHPGPLSIKTRIGFDSEQDFPALLDALQHCPLDFISIHARTRQAGYEPGINVQQLERAVTTLPYPVIGNGDIWDLSDAQSMLASTGVRGLMLGRGAIRDPFLLKELRNQRSKETTTPANRQQYLTFACTLLDAYQAAEATSHKKSYCGTFKEFFLWLSKHPCLGRVYFDSIKRCTCLPAIKDILLQQLSADETTVCQQFA